MTRNKKLAFLILSFFFTAVILSLFLIYPIFRIITKGADELISSKKEASLLKGIIEDKNQNEISYNNIKPSLDKINGLLINIDAPIDLIKFWEDTAKNLGLRIDISPMGSQGATTDNWKSLAFNINVGGSFSNFSKFLDKVENGKYLSQIKSISISEKSDDNSNEDDKENHASDAVNANILVEVYAQK